MMKSPPHTSTDDFSSHGDDIPMFKARGIIPFLAPIDLVEILLDSTKVFLYNKFCNGRKDLLFLQGGNIREMEIDENDEGNRHGQESKIISKIVETETKVPLSGKIIKMRTLIHARKLDDGTYILVSRSVENVSPCSSTNSSARLGATNEIIWGVNVLRRVPGFDDKVDLPNFAQANSSVVPNFLAQKVGMMAANDFFKNLGKIKFE